jgi:CHAT domain-containing protein/tetratricopeptide (TPR) repeat protein
MSIVHRLGSILVVTLLVVATSVSVRAQAPDDLASLNAQVVKLYGQGKYAEATEIAKQFLALAESKFGLDHPSVGTALNNLAELYLAQGRYAEAEMQYERSLGIREKALGLDHPDVGRSLNNLAGLYQAQGRYAEAEPLYRRTISILETALGLDHPDVGTALNNLAELYRAQGRYAEAEPQYKRSLGIREKSLGLDHPDVGTALNNLAALYLAQGRYGEAEPLYKRSLGIRETALGPDHPDVGQSLNNLAALYESQGRYAEAEPLYRRTISIFEKALGPDHPSVGTALNNLAELYRAQGRTGEAEPLYRRTISIYEKALGADHPSVGTGLNNLAELYRAQGRTGEAEPLYKRSLALVEKANGPDHPWVGQSLNNLAALHFVQRDWARAADFWRRSTAVTVRRAQRGTLAGAPLSKGKNEADQLADRFHGLVKVVHRLAASQPDADAALPREMFLTAQWAQGSMAAASLAQMAARGAAGNPGLATIVRERQDLLGEWQRRDGARTTAVSQAPDKRDRQAEAANVVRLTEIDARISGIDKRLAVEFPDYAALSNPEPLSVEQVQADLRPDEALVLFLDTPQRDPTPEETFVWVVTRTDVRWVRSDLGTPTLTREVAALRCGLDATAWRGDGEAKCKSLLASSFSLEDYEAGTLLPFDAARAHKLYMALFGEVRDLIKGRHLLMVPSGPLTQLPLQVLVTEPPAAAGADMRAVRFVAREHALTVLPAVSSLKALRRIARPSGARNPMIGFGNPLLDGNQSHPEYGAHFKQQAALARAHKGCAQAAAKRTAALRGLARGAAPLTQQAGLADLAQLRSQSPLPETADELCAVARDLEADVKEIRLGARATEGEVKALSGGGKLAQFRILHFATHGTLAGQLSGTSEPGLILTPPEKATEYDDGYLSAGEIAGLKLDADWVVLSACNTAGGAGQVGQAGAEALSGLARAFFYAQARALLVSHWEVDSDATVKLIASAVGAISKDKSVGRAEALRRAMLAMIDQGRPREAHPAAWAPFVVVGEGAAAR